MPTLPGRQAVCLVLVAPAVLAGALLCAPLALAQAPALPRGADRAPGDVRPLLGAWDLELVGQPRRCTLTLGVETAARGRQLRFPAICRRALPVLDGIAAWSVGPQGLPRLDDAQGQPVLAFAESARDARLEAKASDGQLYALDSKSYPRAARLAAAKPAENAAAAQRRTTVDPTRAPAADGLPGRYSVMRQANREACRLVLDAPVAAAAGQGKAALEGGCQDTGLTIFDPTGWRYAAGRLTLVARKGHVTDLVFENGQWRKDPAVGAPLMLRRLGS